MGKEREGSVGSDAPDSVVIEEALGPTPMGNESSKVKMRTFNLPNGKYVTAAQCLRIAFVEKWQSATETS